MSDFTGMSAFQVAAEMPLYVYGGGVVLPGLVERRKKEVALFNTPVGGSTNKPSTNKGETITKEYTEKGTAYPNTTLNVRNKPCSITGTVVAQYFVGESVNYDKVNITNKYAWISWIGRSGNRSYMDVRDIATGERFARCV